MTDIRTFFNETKFDVRACGLLFNGDDILVSHESDGTMTLSGGAVKIGETTEQTVVREFFEETNLHVNIEGLVGVIENFFQFNSHPYQQIIFVYYLSLDENKEQDIKFREKVNTTWENKNNVNKLRPEILNDLIHTKNKTINHYINREI